MKSTSELEADALSAVQAIHRRAKFQGDAEAVAALRDIALAAISILDNLTVAPPSHPEIPDSIRAGVSAAHETVKASRRWPVVWDAIDEIREPHLGKIAKGGKGHISRLGIGSKIGIRLEGRRDFSPHSQTGFAEDVFNELEGIRQNPSRHLHPVDAYPELAGIDGLPERTWRNMAAVLPPLSKATVPVWADAGLEFYRDACQGEWESFPWPRAVKGKIGSVTDSNGHQRSIESAVRDKIAEGLKNLF